MTKEQRKMKKDKWVTFSPQARMIATSLKDSGFLKTPERMRGWGMAPWLIDLVAEQIDKAIAEIERA